MTVDALFRTFFEAIEGEAMSAKEIAVLHEVLAELGAEDGPR